MVVAHIDYSCFPLPLLWFSLFNNLSFIHGCGAHRLQLFPATSPALPRHGAPTHTDRPGGNMRTP